MRAIALLFGGDMVREGFNSAVSRIVIGLGSALAIGGQPVALYPAIAQDPDTPVSSPVRGLSGGSPPGADIGVAPPVQDSDGGSSPAFPGSGAGGTEPFQGSAGGGGAEPFQGSGTPVEKPAGDQVSSDGDVQSTEAPAEPAQVGEGVAKAVPVSSSEAALPTEALPGVKESRAIVHYTLSNWYFYRWNLALAEVELEEALKYWPDFKAAHRDLCLVSLFRGNIGRALAEMMMVVGLGEPIPLNEQEKWELNKRALQLHYKKGVEQGRNGYWQDAVAEFQWCLVYDKNDPVVHRSLAFAYSSLGQFAKAEAEYERSFQLDATDAFSRADFAFLLSSHGDTKRALAQMSKAIKMSPAVAALHVDLGWMSESRGDLDTAAQEFRQAAELTPKHAWLWVRLGRIFERQGKAREAIEAYDKAIAVDPDLTAAKQGLERLKTQAKAPS